MITLENALNIVLEHSFVKGTENIDFTLSINRILAEDVVSDLDMPAFDRSAMDGYACKKKDIHQELRIVEIIPAGKIPEKSISDGECAQIMTGAAIPDGADCVLMIEDTIKTGDKTIKFIKEKTHTNIRYKGEDLKKGEIVISKNTLITPVHLALLASVGKTMVNVYEKPVIGIISTGDELVEPQLIPKPTQIRNSNAFQLIGQVLNNNAIPLYMGISADIQENLISAIEHTLEKTDLVLLTGGVSMGEFDYVPAILKSIGAEIKFWKVAVQPGKPTTFAIKDKKMIFGLPGNPVSSYIQYELLVKPAVYKMMGYTYVAPPLFLPFGTEYVRRNTDRMAWIPVIITSEGEVIPVEYHGSAHLNSLADAFGLIHLNIGKSKIEKGELVNVRPI